MGIYLEVIIYVMAVSASLSVTGDSGGSVTITYRSFAETYDAGKNAQIKCSYPKNHESNEKFLCKGQSPLHCEELIHTTKQERVVDNGRFDIRDNQRLKHFIVNIKNLSTADSGTYWCDSDRARQHANYTKTILRVVNVAPKMDSNKMSGDPTNKPPEREELPGMLGGVLGGLALLLIVVVVFILVRHKLQRILVCCAAGGSSEEMTTSGHNAEVSKNHGPHLYEEIQLPNQQASSGDALPSLYATVNLPADQLNYASVNFQKDPLTVSDSNENGSSACDYSVCKTQVAIHPPAAEQTVYSIVTKPGEP